MSSLLVIISDTDLTMIAQQQRVLYGRGRLKAAAVIIEAVDIGVLLMSWRFFEPISINPRA